MRMYVKRFFLWRVMCILLCLVLFFPVAGQAQCSEDEALLLVNQSLNLRLQFLKNAKKTVQYEAASAQQSARIRQLISASGNRNWNAICGEIKSVLVIADDILADGDGKGKKKPWKSCTPERMFSMINAYEDLCVPEKTMEGCSDRKLTNLRRDAARLKADISRGEVVSSDYVDRMCDTYREILEIVND